MSATALLPCRAGLLVVVALLHATPSLAQVTTWEYTTVADSSVELASFSVPVLDQVTAPVKPASPMIASPVSLLPVGAAPSPTVRLLEPVAVSVPAPAVPATINPAWAVPTRR